MVGVHRLRGAPAGPVRRRRARLAPLETNRDLWTGATAVELSPELEQALARTEAAIDLQAARLLDQGVDRALVMDDLGRSFTEVEQDVAATDPEDLVLLQQALAVGYRSFEFWTAPEQSAVREDQGSDPHVAASTSSATSTWVKEDLLGAIIVGTAAATAAAATGSVFGATAPPMGLAGGFVGAVVGALIWSDAAGSNSPTNRNDPEAEVHAESTGGGENEGNGSGQDTTGNPQH